MRSTKNAPTRKHPTLNNLPIFPRRPGEFSQTESPAILTRRSHHSITLPEASGAKMIVMVVHPSGGKGYTAALCARRCRHACCLLMSTPWGFIIYSLVAYPTESGSTWDSVGKWSGNVGTMSEGRLCGLHISRRHHRSTFSQAGHHRERPCQKLERRYHF